MSSGSHLYLSLIISSQSPSLLDSIQFFIFVIRYSDTLCDRIPSSRVGCGVSIRGYFSLWCTEAVHLSHRDDDEGDNASHVSDITEDRTQRQIDDDLAERRKILLAYVNSKNSGGGGGGSSISLSNASAKRQLETIENAMFPNSAEIKFPSLCSEVFCSGGMPPEQNVGQVTARREAIGGRYRVVELGRIVLIHDLKRQGLSVSAIARQTRLNTSVPKGVRR